MLVPMASPQTPFWKWQAILAMLVVSSLIGYLGYYMYEHIENRHLDMVISGVIFILLVVMILLVSYLQEPEYFHKWLKGTDIFPEKEKEKSLSPPRIRKKAPYQYGKKFNI